MTGWTNLDFYLRATRKIHARGRHREPKSHLGRRGRTLLGSKLHFSYVVQAVITQLLAGSRIKSPVGSGVENCEKLKTANTGSNWSLFANTRSSDTGRHYGGLLVYIQYKIFLKLNCNL